MTYFLTLASPLLSPHLLLSLYSLLLLPVSLPFLSLLSLNSQAQLTLQPQPW